MADGSTDRNCDLERPASVLEVVREWQLWAVVGSVGLLLAPVVAGRSTLFFRDIYRQYIGTARLLSVSDHVGWLWDPLLHGGEPLLGNPNRALLYPSRLLYLVVDPVTALNWEIVLHLALAAAAAYLAARSLSLRQEPAMVVALVYGFAGVPLSLTNHLLRMLAYPWMAVAVMAGHRWRSTPARHRWFCVLVAAVMVQGLTGTLETMLCSVLLVTAWQLAGPGRFTARCRDGLLVAGGSLLGAAAAGVQIVPAAATVARSMRPLTADPGFVLAWSLHPGRLLELWFPGILGPVDTATPAIAYWGAGLVDFGFPYLLSVYLGLAATVLALCGVVNDTRGPVTTRRRRMFAVIAVLAVIASCGRFVPGMGLLVDLLGPIALVRFPVKALLLAALPVAVLAGCGVQWVVTGHHAAVRLLLKSAAALSAATLMAWLVTVSWGSCRQRALELLFGRADPMVTAGVSRALLHGAAAVGLVALGAVVAARLRPRWLGLYLAAVVATDLAVAGLAMLPLAPRTLLADEPALADQLRAHIGGGRLFRDRDPAVVHPRLSTNTAAAAAGWWISVLDGELAANYGIPIVFHDDDAVVADRRIVMLTQHVRQAPWKSRLGPLSAAGVSLVMTPDEPPVEGLEHVVEVVPGGKPAYHLFRNPGARTGAWWVAHAVPASSAAEALAAVTGDTFDPSREVVLEAEQDGRAGPEWLPERIMLEQRIDEFDAIVPAAGHLVFSDVWTPGLRVEVDGRDVQLRRANYAFAAIAVEGGHHRIRRMYRPPEVTLGLWLSTAALCCVVVVAGSGAVGSGRRWRGARDVARCDPL